MKAYKNPRFLDSADARLLRIVSEFIEPQSKGGASRFAGYAGDAQAAAIRPLSQVSAEQAARTSTGLSELDRVLGGGMVPGSTEKCRLDSAQPETRVSTKPLQRIISM